MLDTASLLELHRQASEELRASIDALYEHKDNQYKPDFDHTELQRLYDRYLQKKEDFKNIHLDYLASVKKNGIHFYCE